ncbi:hypothetical protein VII00023_20075 [Vibrio ichthyoenteri ATCC 700023]|uniref:Uncharacterized protein n=1 Tax=Vibrio ichthyoenteri ATCC 700023 TaxID=870968 RepID=F9RZE7_9VIBR|nr:hypothetical protein VII00023_20075 [Vibrio ichthyoenteri ATCC 700023]
MTGFNNEKRLGKHQAFSVLVILEVVCRADVE